VTARCRTATARMSVAGQSSEEGWCPDRPPEPRSWFSESLASGSAPSRGEFLRAYLAACVASRCEPSWELRVQFGTGPQSMERGLKSENGRMACIPCPLVRMTISADWSPLS
jgi:hypothetical protein